MPTLNQTSSVVTTSPFTPANLVVNSCGSHTAATTAAINYNAQIAFLQQQQQPQQHQNLLTLGQHPLYDPNAGFPVTAASLYTLPTQIMWPAQLPMAATNPPAAYTAAYPPASGSLISADSLALFQTHPYLAAASFGGLKRPHSGEFEADGAKRLRLSAMPF
jgi:hypothetical protein